MKNEEAKFILGAYRPDGRDAGDPTFGPALSQAESDPELRAWFQKQRQFDASVAAKLQQVAPPPGLREAILTGSRVSVAARAKPGGWTRSATWLAAAAAVAVLATAGALLRPRTSLPSGQELAAFAVRELASSHDNHVGHPPELADIQARLVSARLPLTRSLDLNLDELRRRNCRRVKLGGRDLFEICFQRDGTWYHVYVGRRGDFGAGALDPNALVNVQGEFAATVWTDADRVYALVTSAGAEALRRVI